jgi:hypothetical protein
MDRAGDHSPARIFETGVVFMENVAQQSSPYTMIDIMSRYPSDKYNVLIPVSTVFKVSPFHRISVNFVKLDPDPEVGKDVYELDGKLALSKQGIMKIAHAAGIQVKGSRVIRLENSDIRVEVEVLVPMGDGTFRQVMAGRDWLEADEKKNSMSKNKSGGSYFNEKLFDRTKRFRSAITESKAMLRAIRSALSLKQVYTKEELARTFVVPVTTIDYSDPALREAMIQRLASGIDLLYGTPPALAELSGDEPVWDDSAGNENAETANDESSNNSSVEESKLEPIHCAECGTVMKGFTSAKGKSWTRDDWIEQTTKRFGRPLCPYCSVKQSKVAAA